MKRFITSIKLNLHGRKIDIFKFTTIQNSIGKISYIKGLKHEILWTAIEGEGFDIYYQTLTQQLNYIEFEKEFTGNITIVDNENNEYKLSDIMEKMKILDIEMLTTDYFANMKLYTGNKIKISNKKYSDVIEIMW